MIMRKVLLKGVIYIRQSRLYQKLGFGTTGYVGESGIEGIQFREVLMYFH